MGCGISRSALIGDSPCPALPSPQDQPPSTARCWRPATTSPSPRLSISARDLGATAFSIQLYHIASSESVGIYTKGLPASELTNGATVPLTSILHDSANAPTGPYRISLTANTADSNWTLLFAETNTLSFDVEPAVITAGPTTTTPSTIVLGGTIASATSFTIDRTWAIRSLSIQLVRPHRQREAISIYAEDFPPVSSPPAVSFRCPRLHHSRQCSRPAPIACP